MFHTGSQKPEQEKLLLYRRSLETSLPGLRQPLAYVRHLRSYWRPERRAKLIVPTSWMEFLASADGKCSMECVVDKCCPFRGVRFEKTRLVAPDEELPRDIVSQLLTNFGTDDCLATFVPRAFEGIPRTKLRSDVSAMGHFSQSAPRRIDFALVPGHGSDDAFPENNTRCLLLGMKEPTQMQHPHSVSFDPRPSPLTLASIPEELTSHGQFHLTLLASLLKGEAVGATFPEWLVLFGLIYDAHHVRIVAYVPQRRKLDVIGYTTCIVDELSLHSSITGVPACELALERLRFLLALTTLRRHVHHLSKSLFTPTDSHDDIRRTDNQPLFLGCSAYAQHNSDDSDSLNRCASLGSGHHCSSEYSTCPSSVHARELYDVTVLECGEELSSSCRSCASSFCSTCLSLESASTFDSLYSEDSKNTNSNYMEPSTISLSQGGNEGVACPNKLAETKRREIIAWAREVIPTEHPVKDTYRMVIHQPHPKRRRVADSISSTRG